MRVKVRTRTGVQLTTDGERYYTFNREDEGEVDERMGCSAQWFKTGHKFYAVRDDSRKVEDLWLIECFSRASSSPENL